MRLINFFFFEGWNFSFLSVVRAKEREGEKWCEQVILAEFKVEERDFLLITQSTDD